MQEETFTPQPWLKPVLFVMIVAFAGYSTWIVCRAFNGASANALAIQQGRLVWQQYNCQACHQLYGLGGYLGPDLTNITSAAGRTDAYLRAVIQTGNRQMPSFPMNEEELVALLVFLHAANQSGRAAPHRFRALPDGMIEQEAGK